jgi:hypothetical protein
VEVVAERINRVPKEEKKKKKRSESCGAVVHVGLGVTLDGESWSLLLTFLLFFSFLFFPLSGLL